MAQVLPPSMRIVGDLGALLDLIQDPVKYTKLFSELTSFQEQVKSQLGDLDTKDKAEVFLHRAQVKLQEADSYANKLRKDTDKANAAAREFRDKANKMLDGALRTDKEANELLAEAGSQMTQLNKDKASYENYKEEQKLSLEIASNDLDRERSSLLADKTAWEAKLQKVEDLLT